jgi:hypothetical protein
LLVYSNLELQIFIVRIANSLKLQLLTRHFNFSVVSLGSLLKEFELAENELAERVTTTEDEEEEENDFETIHDE